MNMAAAYSALTVTQLKGMLDARHADHKREMEEAKAKWSAEVSALREAMSKNSARLTSELQAQKNHSAALRRELDAERLFELDPVKAHDQIMRMT